MGGYRVGIVIPALNESATIAEVVAGAKVYGVPIVVDDGSTDTTTELALRAGAVVVTHEGNRGYDAALNTGFKKADELACEIVITLDADGQHDPLLIQKFIGAVDAGAELVVGSRSRRQRFSEHLFGWYTNLRFEIVDPLCGMKAYRIGVYRARGYFDSFGSVGTELAISSAKRGCRLSNVSFKVLQRSGKSRFGQTLTGNYKIIRAMLIAIWRVDIRNS